MYEDIQISPIVTLLDARNFQLPKFSKLCTQIINQMILFYTIKPQLKPTRTHNTQ